ncbi:methylated-DNA--[protein]-cysteine S-methyltransferase [Carboxylicivirga sp. N1Y90]|uniref:methylated-DNA--[protein]-cysteine S-methyltransferase n=1 Tax=Carboxylicivirga fragile TaxID=3417571 RepID=UPI003D3407F3|nr:methylated-DNA--[protein]-cysteine S-methyltransferase [Marinilabiliaceae bacterium N1Y90]
MNTIFIQYYKSPVGELIIGDYEGELCICDWRHRKMRPAIDKRILIGLSAEYLEGETELTKACVEQLTAYFKKERSTFDLPLKLVGSDFQQSVWKALMQIPFGQTQSYLGLSKLLKNEKAIRAVASANGANAISIIVPCHRIIGSKGELTGYAGGLPAKKKLLQLEGAHGFSNQLELF